MDFHQTPRLSRERLRKLLSNEEIGPYYEGGGMEIRRRSRYTREK
jgi:hypothetical protein